MITLRAAVNTLRLYYTLSPARWKEPIVAIRTQIRDWPLHVQEIRVALVELIAAINLFDLVSTFDIPGVPWIPLDIPRPSADVMNQLRDLILSL
jgi:hypothetical protein